MNSVYLVNHRPQNCEPFKSITQLPLKEALEVANKLFERNKNSGWMVERFGQDFEAYYKYRIEIEKYLYEKFIELGGKPKTAHPLYFYVHRWSGVEDAWLNNETHKIALSEIDASDISFTLGDTCVETDDDYCNQTMNRPGFGIEPFLKGNFLEVLSLNNNDVEKLIQNVEQQIGYGMIEAQIWNDKYFLCGD